MTFGKKYRGMIYAAVSTIHFYRKDFVPSELWETWGEIAENNRVLVQRVREEVKSIFNYELSDIQMAKALDAYGCSGKSVADTITFVPKAA